MKTVYFVRHGQSESNARSLGAYRGKDSPLTELGRQQAQLIAARAMHLPFEVLISSPWARAKDTALAIAERTNKDVEFSELFTETRGPDSLIGMSVVNPLFWKKYTAWSRSQFIRGERVEDGENFDDLMERADAALGYLEERTEQCILVATHGLFLRILMARIALGTLLTPELLQAFAAATKTDNTGISMFTFGTMVEHEIDKSERWRVRVFNDHAHLGEVHTPFRNERQSSDAA